MGYGVVLTGGVYDGGGYIGSGIGIWGTPIVFNKFIISYLAIV